MIHIVVTIDVRPDRLGEFLALADAHAAASRREPGCRRFELLRCLHEPTRFQLQETFRDRAAITAHQQTPHYATWRRCIGTLESRPRQHEEYEALDGTTTRIVFVNGCFDVLHAGHAYLLLKAAQQGERLIVALNDDASVRRLKGEERPVVPLADRMAVVSSVRGVDDVTAFGTEAELADMLHCLRPDVMVKGSDYRNRKITGAEFVGRVHFVERLGEHSTTNILMRDPDGTICPECGEAVCECCPEPVPTTMHKR